MCATKPQLPSTALELFVKDIVEEHERLHNNSEKIQKDLFQKTALDAWSQIPHTVKMYYEKKAIDDRARYQKELMDSDSPTFTTPKPKRDSNNNHSGTPAIKKPLSGYLLFCDEMRPKIKEENPNISFAEMTKLISHKWQEVDKTIYAQKYKEAKEEYDSLCPPVSAKRRKKDPNAPKKPLSAFLFYCEEVRPSVKKENPDISFGDLSKLMGKMWEQCPDKSKYEELAKEAKDKYKSEQENLNSSQTLA